MVCDTTEPWADVGLDLLDPALVWVAKKGEDVHATTPL
jgi:hypothetical protein